MNDADDRNEKIYDARSTGSRYDQLHDKYFQILNGKHGSRYERLAAVVFKCLRDRHTVVHDLRLVGGSKVKHQIDVLIEGPNGSRRVLVECKDFDQSGHKVGLGIVRDFRSVVEDIRPDEAFILTCTGFTRQATQYAGAKGVKLAVLRIFEESDWEGRIRSVSVKLVMTHPARVLSVSINATTEDAQRFALAMQSGDNFPQDGSSFRATTNGNPVWLSCPEERISILDFADRETSCIAPVNGHIDTEVNIDPDRWTIEINDEKELRFEKAVITIRKFAPTEQIFESCSNRIAELILTGFGDTDVIIFDDQMKQVKFDSYAAQTVD